MELQSKAQLNEEEMLMVEDHDHGPMPAQIILTPISAPMEMPLEVVDESPMHEHMEVAEPGQVEIVIEDLGSIPGLMGDLDPAKEQLLEVIEEPEETKNNYYGILD